MKRTFVLFLSLVMLFASSCLMKNLLWDYLGIERAMPAKAIASLQEDLDLMGSSEAYLALCAANSDNSLDSIAVIPATFDAPILLLLGLFILSWTFSGVHPTEKPYTRANYPTSSTVPLYLKLGRLILYS